MADRMTAEDEFTLRTLAYIQRTTVAEQRRLALAAYARRARRDSNVALIVRNMLASAQARQQQARERSNVIQIHGRRHA